MVMEQEWLNEPNEVEFEYKGFKCMILRVPQMGHLCGYVNVDDVAFINYEREISCHGGITFEGGMNDRTGNWIGFDCAHFMDLLPSMHNIVSMYSRSRIFGNDGQTYKNIEFVTNEIHSIVDQLIELKGDLK